MSRGHSGSVGLYGFAGMSVVVNGNAMKMDPSDSSSSFSSALLSLGDNEAYSLSTWRNRGARTAEL